MRSILVTLFTVCAMEGYGSGMGEDTVYYELWDIDNLESIGGHGLTVLGDPVIESTDLGDAIRFDGEGDQLLVDFNPIMEADEFTIELVFKPDACYPDNPDPRFLHIQDPDDPEEKRTMIELRINKNNQCYMDGFMKTDQESLALMDETLVHETEVWQHVAITYKDHILTTYFNGLEELNGEVLYTGKIINPTGKTSIGARMNNRKYFSGLIRTLKVTHAALDPSGFIFIHGQPALSSSGTPLTGSGGTTIYPNPAHHELRLKPFPGADDVEKFITITDTSGRVLLVRKTAGGQNDVVTINTLGFAEGIYLVQISSGLQSEYLKLVISHAYGGL
jgi:hypothetical protein